MKSIMQEASSLGKAIEQGWVKAGKPQEFSIRILEEAQKNFLGMTTRSAKIALYFGEKPVRQQAPATQPQPKAKPAPRPAAKELPEKREFAPTQQPAQREQTHQKRQQDRPANEQKELAPRDQQRKDQQPRQRRESQWTPAMIELASNWMNETLRTLELNDISFTIEPQNFYLRITFDKHLLPEQERERRLLAHCANLLIETLKRRFRVGLRGHKIVLTHVA